LSVEKYFAHDSFSNGQREIQFHHQEHSNQNSDFITYTKVHVPNTIYTSRFL